MMLVSPGRAWALQTTASNAPVVLLSRSFLFSKEGNPNKRNVHNETCLHVLCQGPMILLLSAGALSPRLARPERDEQLRADCLQVRVRLTNVMYVIVKNVNLRS